jgi:hypothetical protein
MRKIHHPNDRAARRRSAEAKALEKLKPKRIDAKKRKILVALKEKETKDELRAYSNNVEIERPRSNRSTDVRDWIE